MVRRLVNDMVNAVSVRAAPAFEETTSQLEREQLACWKSQAERAQAAADAQRRLREKRQQLRQQQRRQQQQQQQQRQQQEQQERQEQQEQALAERNHIVSFDELESFEEIQWKTSPGQRAERRRAQGKKETLPALYATRMDLLGTRKGARSIPRAKVLAPHKAAKNHKLQWSCRECRKKLPRRGNFISLCRECSSKAQSHSMSGVSRHNNNHLHHHRQPVPPGPCLFGSPIGQGFPSSSSQHSFTRKAHGYFNPRDALSAARFDSRGKAIVEMIDRDKDYVGDCYKSIMLNDIGDHAEPALSGSGRVLRLAERAKRQVRRRQSWTPKARQIRRSVPRGVYPRQNKTGMFVSGPSSPLRYELTLGHVQKYSGPEFERIKKKGMLHRKIHQKGQLLTMLEARLSKMLNVLQSKQRNSVRIETLHRAQRRAGS